MSEPRILIERRGDVVLVGLRARNSDEALDREAVAELHAALTELEQDEGIAALVLHAAGEPTFFGAAEVGQLQGSDSADALDGAYSMLLDRVEEFPAPVIAAVRGRALAEGCELAVACDLRVVGESARFGLPGVALGLMPAAGGSHRLPRLVGLGRARELIYTGREVEAAEALRIGMVTAVVPDSEVVDRALALAAQIAGSGRLAVRAAKRALNALARPGHENATAFECALQAALLDSEERRARTTAAQCATGQGQARPGGRVD